VGAWGKAKVQKVTKLVKHSIRQREITAIGRGDALFAHCPLPGSTIGYFMYPVCVLSCM